MVNKVLNIFLTPVFINGVLIRIWFNDIYYFACRLHLRSEFVYNCGSRWMDMLEEDMSKKGVSVVAHEYDDDDLDN